MPDSSNIRFDPFTQTLQFAGNCTDSLSACQAFCCRKNWNVLLDANEASSQRYDSETICLYSRAPCSDEKIPCVNRQVRLKKKPDGSCMYLDDASRCSIYETRPAVCRAFNCEKGWKLLPPETDPKAGPPRVESVFREGLTGAMVFIPNPVLEFKTSFYSKESGNIVIVARRVDACGTVNVQAVLCAPNLTDDIIAFAVSAFDGVKTLFEVRKAIADRFGTLLSDGEFFDLVALLRVQNLILFRIAPAKQA